MSHPSYSDSRKVLRRRGRGSLGLGFLLAVAVAAASLIAGAQNNIPKKQAAPTRRQTILTPDTAPIRPAIPSANRYQRDKVFLERAAELRAEPGTDYQTVVGDVLFRKGDMYMYCDSALFFDGGAEVRAFGNVRMEQGDTLFVYGDELNYNDTTQLAILYADTGKKVRLINKDVKLTTDIFNYDLGIELGY